MNKDLYPVNTIDAKKIEAYVDPETGEIIDIDGFEKEMREQKEFSDNLKMTLINKTKIAIASQNMIKDEIDRLKSLLDVQERREASVKRFLKTLIEIGGEIDFGKCGAKLKKNPPKVEIKDATKLEHYVKVEIKEERKLDKNAIKADLKNGKEVDGAILIQEQRVDIF